eukprot:CAMPEP_0179425750 /NCGR_PEP_ID=MMETSP0799-20121207/12346_1 /TAXON_ID=46947 /ORGANISM="Geminigera cryophila, Strain CCMP2564" /LENGTH=116 /DNA_ID=CAMNT_0021200405 /DNA_START=96 /DNA_END=446 /DNA_ORIENTATION=+
MWSLAKLSQILKHAHSVSDTAALAAPLSAIEWDALSSRARLLAPYYDDRTLWLLLSSFDLLHQEVPGSLQQAVQQRLDVLKASSSESVDRSSLKNANMLVSIELLLFSLRSRGSAE